MMTKKKHSGMLMKRIVLCNMKIVMYMIFSIDTMMTNETLSIIYLIPMLKYSNDYYSVNQKKYNYYNETKRW